MGSRTTRLAARILLRLAAGFPADEAGRALLGERSEALLGVLAGEEITELLGLPLERTG
jgi:hypothetical protein